MTPERKQALFSMANSDYIRGVTKDEIQELEKEYNIKCSSYSCGSCVLNYLKRLSSIKQN